MSVLKGIKVIEFSAIGPVPFCGMMLADMGAEVIRIDRMQSAELGLAIDGHVQITNRGKRSISVDLKNADGLEIAKKIIASADVVLEGFRPTVMERLGLGPFVCLEQNPRLIYARMTGWGQSGPLSLAAGHDINYIALSGALHGIGQPSSPPAVPLNLIGDYGGGALYLTVGILGALIERSRSGSGQIVDAAMVDGVISLMTHFFSMMASNRWQSSRGTEVLNGGAHFYRTYETADGLYVAVGAIERKFYLELLEKLSFSSDQDLVTRQWDQDYWPTASKKFEKKFLQRSRQDWVAEFHGTDACVSPVLNLAECSADLHLNARNAILYMEKLQQPAPAPRFSRTPSSAGKVASHSVYDTIAILSELGVAQDYAQKLVDRSVVG